MSYRLTGISIPIGGISWERGKSTKEYAQSFVDLLCGQRIFFASCDLGCGNCDESRIRSLSKIKGFINDQLADITDENDYKSCLRTLRSITNTFLDESICKKLTLFMPYSKVKVFCPIIKYRKDVMYYLKIIIDMFELPINNDIDKVLSSNQGNRIRDE